MTTANHALAGTLIALTARQPALAIPLAFLSHFVLDSLPHYGHPGLNYGENLRQRRTIILESFGIVGLIAIAFTGVWGWALAFICAIAACSPDLEWPLWYNLYERRGKTVPRNKWTEFHNRVQREYHWGIFVEIAVFIVGFVVLLKIR